MRLLLDLIFCYSCCLHFLLAVSSIADAGDDGLNACVSSTCANVKNVTFPFGATPSCAASPTFLLSNCTTKQAYWNNFSKAIIYGAEPPLVPPAVLGISSLGYSIGQVNLTWNRNLIENVELPYNICTPAPSSNISDYLPYPINLTVFADPAFVVSPHNIYLLFDCTNLTSLQSHDLQRLLEKNSSYCRFFQKQCKLPGNPNCLQFAPDNELMLQSVMNRLSCKRFQFFLTLNASDYVVKEWRAGIVQLTWTNSKCTNCEKSNGTCNYDKHNNFECSNAAECHGLCSTRSKIATGVATSGVVIAVLAVLAVCSLQWRRHFSTKSVPKSSSNKFSTQRALCLSAKFGPVSVQEFSYEELQEATESFADENLIGNGGFGAVYVGLLRDGVKVAIKRLYHDNFTRMEQFYNEMKILSSLQHPNLVKLYGFCCQDDRDLLLVFEYASKGTVSDQLHDPNKPGMPWEVRLNIAWETAEALSYLHNSAIFHRDVKTTNILLDDKFHAKLADFGLSRLVPLEVTHVSTAPQGTPGYVDPEYHQCYQLTYKSDVYSFGVVLMELVSAKLAVDMSRNRKEINLSGLALTKIACGAWEELVDPRLEMDKNPDVERMVKGVVELAFECLHAEKDDRPNMSLVAETLANLRRLSVSGYEEVINAQNSKVDIDFLSADETMKSESAFNSASSLNSLRSSAWRSCNTSSGF